jgi:tetratricopeptide (TPR) repeat protein
MVFARGPWVALLMIALVAATGCARSPEARMARHLERGDRYFAKAQYPEAILEYRNALRIEPANAQAMRQLGLAHFHAGELIQAYSRLIRSRETEPGNLTVRLKLGTIFAMAEDREKAWDEALFVLGQDPKNLEALTILAVAARTREDVDAAVQRLEAVRSEFGDRARGHLALAGLYERGGNPAAAERAYQDAVAADPKAPESHIALGNFYWGRRDATRAEQEYKTAAELAPAGSWARMKLADFYVLAGKRDEARRILQETTAKAPDFLTAWRRLAEMAFAEQKYDESIKALDVVLKKNPTDASGRFLRGRVHLIRREFPEAIQAFQEVLRLEPGLTQARHQLALAYLKSGSPTQARAELRLATKSDPEAVAPTLDLAELDIRSGAIQPAIEALQDLAAKQPNEVRTYVLLGRAHLAKGEFVKASETYRRIMAVAPKDPRGPYLMGVALRLQGKALDARKQFEAALVLKPDFAGPLAELAAMSVAEKRPDLAIERVKKQVTLVPTSGKFHHLLGRMHQARREREAAERAYLKAIELEPGLMTAYVDLSGLYLGADQPDQALARLEDAVARNRSSPLTHTLMGSVYEQKGDIPSAARAYEKALSLNGRFVPAANNLAYLYSEHGGDQAKALQLAQLAREAAPEDPYIADTLGRILYKSGVYQRALALLQESADKLPGSPEVQYHLGMAAHKTGDRETARRALTAAVSSPATFPGKTEASSLLVELRR